MIEAIRRRVHRVEVLIIDHDDVGADGVRDLLEHTKYPNRAIRPHVMGVESREVEWTDEHPLNHTATCGDTYRRLFGLPSPDTAARELAGDPSPSAAGDGSVLDLLTARLAQARRELDRHREDRKRLIEMMGERDYEAQGRVAKALVTELEITLRLARAACRGECSGSEGGPAESTLDRLLTGALDTLTPEQAHEVRAEMKRWVESVGRLHDVWRSSSDTLAQLGLVLEAEGMRRMALHHEDPWHAGFMIGEAFALLRASKLLALMASAGRMREHRDEQHEGTAT